MSTHTGRLQLRRLVFLLALLLLVLHFPGETSHAASLPAASVTLAMSNPACYQIHPANGACTIKINSLTATGSDSSFSRLEVLVNGKLRVFMGGFFESSAYLAYPMLSGGLTVACGRPNDGGLPDFGKAYMVTANAYRVDGTSASESVNVFCPAFEGKTFIPLLRNK